MTDARTTALSILDRLDHQTETLDQILITVLDQQLFANPKDRALTHALVFGVTRWRQKLDWVIEKYSRTRLKKIDPTILNILRMGVYQLLYLDRIPDSAAVNTAVEMGKKTDKPWIAKFINGLLRNIARSRKELPFPSMEDNPVEHLSICYSFPRWLIKKWLKRHSCDEVVSICRAASLIPPITIRTNSLAVSRNDLKQSLIPNVDHLSETPHSSAGLRFTAPRVPISELAGYQDGWFQVQDEAAQIVSMLAGPKPGQSVLDACAGLGGKTGHLAELMKNQGRITAIDNRMPKLRKLEDEMNRLGCRIVETVLHDLHSPLKQIEKESYDQVLLDAPCSGLGVIRRNPDIKWNSSKKNLSAYQERQVEFLSNLADLVKPGGRLTFAVCSTEPEENDCVLDRFLRQHPSFQLEDRSDELPESLTRVIYRNRRFTSHPHRDDMDGFFAACFRKSSA